jgi:DNA repair exonuclease SbcCD ATPase subunit
VADAVREALQDENLLKSLKDRRFNQIQRSLDEVSPVLEKVKGILTPEQQAQFSQIQRDAEFEDLKQRVYGTPQTQTGVPQSGTPGSAAVDVETTVKKLQFADNDPALAALRIKHANNPTEFLNAAAELRISQLQTPSLTPATTLPQTGTPMGRMTDDQVIEKSAQLEELYKNYSRNKPQIEALEKELEAAGVIKAR